MSRAGTCRSATRWSPSPSLTGTAWSTALVGLADAELRAALDAADRLAGHQLTSDLAVLAAAAGAATAPNVAAARDVWRARHGDGLAERRVIDTRYDLDHVLRCVSRRLVDVCAALDLDVTLRSCAAPR
ncbi:MAG: hypothetical protein ACRDZ4_22950 [Egibacteraceae bacterium]